MRYYVVSDIHGFFDELKTALTKAGFFEDKKPHKLVICGDLLDRGKQSLQVQSFVLDLLEKDQVILIRGNHEDLLLEMIKQWDEKSFFYHYHNSNGTLGTVLQLTKSKDSDLLFRPNTVKQKLLESPFVKNIMPSMLDYYETANYIFVHGWIPCFIDNWIDVNKPLYSFNPNWRNSTKNQWNDCRWINGQEAAFNKIIEPHKTIVCGHWHCSFGHANYEGKGKEFDHNSDFSPYYSKGIIAIDGATAYSKMVNCIVLED